jgi:hypothetical protein
MNQQGKSTTPIDDKCMAKQEHLLENQGYILQSLLSQHHFMGLQVDHYLS